MLEVFMQFVSILMIGDIILCPDGNGVYHIGEISFRLLFCKGEILPHRRKVNWHSKTLDRVDMSKALKAQQVLVYSL